MCRDLRAVSRGATVTRDRTPIDHLITYELSFESGTVIWAMRKKDYLVIEWATIVIDAFIGHDAHKTSRVGGTFGGMLWSDMHALKQDRQFIKLDMRAHAVRLRCQNLVDRASHLLVLGPP